MAINFCILFELNTSINSIENYIIFVVERWLNKNFTSKSISNETIDFLIHSMEALGGGLNQS